LFFVLGFSTVFALLGVLLNTLLSGVAYDAQIWLGRVGGVVIIFFGLYLVGLVKPKFLQQEHKLQIKHQFGSRWVTSFVFGAAFAVGWTPCVGAVLGGILAIAATQPGSAFALLLFYAIGLGIPFLLVGLFTAQATAWIHKYGKYLAPINKVFGVVLILMGILVFTNNLSRLANFELLNRFLLN
jgi:cytochrome c-type biogenesis protein